jgi:hypothetical protein
MGVRIHSGGVVMSDILFGLPAHEYFAAPRINCSGLKIINKSPMHYRASLEQTREETKAMQIGSAVHCAILEKKEFNQRYTTLPEGLDRRTKEGKAIFAEIEASGKIVLSHNDHEDVVNMALSVRNHETASRLIWQGQPEVTVFTEVDDIPAKCRLDWYRPGIIVDVKTTDDASPVGFARSCANYGYHLQAAWYMDCCAAANVPADNFIFLVVEKTAPYAVALYELDLASLEVGRTQYQHALNIYKHCLATDTWPGYSDNIMPLQLPAWAMREIA